MEYVELKPDTPLEVRRKVHQLKREREVLVYKIMILIIAIMAVATLFVVICNISTM